MSRQFPVRPAHLTVRNLITLTISGKEYKLQNSSLCNVPGIRREVSKVDAARDFICLFTYLSHLKALQKLKINSIKWGNDWQRIGKGVEKKGCRGLFQIPFQHFSGGTEEIQKHISGFGDAVSIRTRRSRAQFRSASAHSVNMSYCPNPGIVIASPLRRKPARRRSRAPHPDWQRFLRENTAARSLLWQRLPYAPSNNSTTARHRLSGWLADWLAGWLADWLAGIFGA